METLKTYGAAWAQSENDTPCMPAILELENKLSTLGFSPLRIGGRNHTHPMVYTLAIEMPNGHPLFINMQNCFANRQKGYINFFCTMPANAKQGFICDAQEKSALVAPNNCSIKTLTAKKLGAVVEYHTTILSAALHEAYAGRALVAEWRERVKNSGLKVRIKRVLFWYLWNQCDNTVGRTGLYRANFLLCAWLSKVIGGDVYWYSSADYKRGDL